jgi:predicted DNA-binding transcriptional regulator AlpA
MIDALEQNPHRVLDVRAAAQFLGSSKSSLDKLRLTGGGPDFVKIGEGVSGRVGYRLCDLQSWLASRVRRSTSDMGASA